MPPTNVTPEAKLIIKLYYQNFICKEIREMILKELNQDYSVAQITYYRKKLITEKKLETKKRRNIMTFQEQEVISEINKLIKSFTYKDFNEVKIKNVLEDIKKMIPFNQYKHINNKRLYLLDISNKVVNVNRKQHLLDICMALEEVVKYYI